MILQKSPGQVSHPNSIDPARKANRRGERFFKDGNLTASLVAFEEAIRMKPEYAVAYNNMGVVHWRLGNLELGLKYLQEALKYDPESEDALANLSTLRNRLSEVQKLRSDKNSDKVRHKPDIRILHHMARSGGTIISRCLGCMNGILLLSEVHPFSARIGDQFNPLNQAQKWFNLCTVEERTNMEKNSLSFPDTIAYIQAKAKTADRELLLRDWSHLDFTGIPFLKRPRYRLSSVLALRKNFNVVHVATVRHPIDQWLSLKTLDLMKDKLSLDRFLFGYLAFAKQAAQIGYHKYEDFTADPGTFLTELCRELKLPFDSAYKYHWMDYSQITGDAPRDGDSTRRIRRPRRPPVDSTLLDAFKQNSNYWEALALLQYEHRESQRDNGNGTAVRADTQTPGDRDKAGFQP